jgi:hypothetical protein
MPKGNECYHSNRPFSLSCTLITLRSNSQSSRKRSVLFVKAHVYSASDVVFVSLSSQHELCVDHDSRQSVLEASQVFGVYPLV